MPKIEVTARPHEIIDGVFFGDDGPFQFVATEVGDLLSAYLVEDEDEQAVAVLRAKMKWLKAGFHEDDWAHLQARVADEADPLKTQHLFTMYDELKAAVTGRPPTLPTASSPAPDTSTGEVRPKARAATSGDSPQVDSAT